MANPKVSVVIPCFNQGAYLEEAIDSVLASDYGDYEIIVVDDGSADPATRQLVENLEKPRTRVLLGLNRGVAAARNTGIMQASGEYILPLDADDKISKAYIGKGVKVLDTDPCIGIVYCRARKFGVEKGPWRLPEYSFPQMLASNLIFCSSFFRKTDWEKVGGFKPELIHGKEDWEFWLSLLELGVEVYRIQEVHFYYRVQAVSRDITSNEADHRRETLQLIYDLHQALFDEHLPGPLELYQENLRLKHLIGRFDYRWSQKLFSPVFFLKKMFKIP